MTQRIASFGALTCALMFALLPLVGCDKSAAQTAAFVLKEATKEPSTVRATRSSEKASSLPGANEDGIECHFSPSGGCTEAVVRELNAARQTILVQAYSFTSAPIAKALVDAHHRGVQITVILDKSQRTEKYSEADFVAHAEIPCYIDAKHAIAHNKIMLIDGRTIITGSFNFTKQAEQANAENLLVLHDKPDLFAAYEANFQAHLEHSEKYDGK